MAVESYATAKAANQLNDAALQFYLSMISGQNKDGTNFAIPTTATVAAPPGAATGAQTSVASSASSVTILASNAAREGALIYNDSTQILYLLLDSAQASASTSIYTVQVPSQGYFEVPGPSVYTGIIKGIWAAANGSARVTEFSA